MSSQLLSQRRSGILLHPTSLPGPHGHGDLGPDAHHFAGFLAAAGQSWWQMLPVGPPGRGNSPYDSVSSFAGGALLISLQRLAADGLLEVADLEAPSALSSARARYGEARRFREARLRRAFERFTRQRSRREALARYEAKQRAWLPDYALFCALKGAHGGAAWNDWDPSLRNRHPEALRRARRQLAQEVRYHVFLQYQFDRQWAALRSECHKLGITLLGDVPMFVAYDSADVWAHQDLFYLDRRGRPTAVAAVPPDAFSRTGQLWGNPLYRWDRLARSDYGWWISRLRRNLQRFDAVRLDHFIGFHRCWRVNARARTAIRGRFVRGPGESFFFALRAALGGLPFVAEDLGKMVPEVGALRDQFELPGMRVLQFGFDGDEAGLQYQPHRYPPRSVAYTGTHDNDTLVGWFRGSRAQAGAAARRRAQTRRRRVLRYSGSDGREIHWDLIRVVLMTAANTTIFPLQDLLGLGSKARMNVPGTARGNWEWRVLPPEIDPALAERMARLCQDYERT